MSGGTGLRLLLVMALWSACFPLITLGLASAPHLAFGAMRAIIAGASLLGLGCVLGRAMPVGWYAWALLVVMGLGATTLGFLGMFHGAEYVAPGLATVIANIQPLLAALLACVFLAEKLGWRGSFGLAVGFAGILIIAWPGVMSAASNTHAVGIAYIVLSAAGVAIANVAMKRLAGQVDALMAMGIQLLFGSIPLVLLSLSTEDPASIDWSARFVLVLLALAVLVTSVAFWLWFTALEATGLNGANAFTFLVPVFGLAIGIAFFGEKLSWFAAGGGALAVVGVTLVQRDSDDRAASTGRSD